MGGTRNRISAINPLAGSSSHMGFAGSNPIAAASPWQGIQNPVMPGMFNMGVNPSQFFVPPTAPPSDPSFFAAHQQAMMVAKQAYQMAVAQQAMAAAGDEWERGSNVGGFGAAGMGVGSGMGMGWMPPMFSMSAQSMYAGSSVGGGSNVGVGWGSSSVYGETFGPATIARRSQNPANMNFPSDNKHQLSSNPRSSVPRSESSGNLSSMQPSSRSGGANKVAPRQRTRTAPSNAPLPPQHARFGGRHSPLPPSSWKPAH